MQTLLRDDELVALNDTFEDAHPREVLSWALETSGLRRIAIASAFQAEGTAIMHMASTIRPEVPVLFLETGFQFAETLAFKEQLAERLGLNVIDLYGELTVERQAEQHGERLYERNPELCCELNKVRPMFEALRGLDAWITAFRRDSSPTRADAPFVEQYELEPGHMIVKVEPGGGMDEARHLGVPARARPAAQPAVRPGLRVDRMRAVHAIAVRRASPSARVAGPACRSGSAASTSGKARRTAPSGSLDGLRPTVTTRTRGAAGGTPAARNDGAPTTFARHARSSTTFSRAQGSASSR